MLDPLTHAAREERQARVELSTHQVASLGPLKLVGIDGAVEVNAVGWQPPPGSLVWMLRQGNRALVLGADQSVRRPAPIGTVGAITAGQPLAVTTTDGQAWQLPYLATYLPTVGDKVSLQWDQDSAGKWAGVVLGKIIASTPAAAQTGTEVVSPPTVDTPQRLRVVATDTATSYGGFWSFSGPEPTQGRYGSGQAASGWVWYGAAAFAQAAGKTVVSATIQLHRVTKWDRSASVTAHLVLHDGTAKAGAPPAVLATTDLPSVPLGVSIQPFPAAWIARMADPSDAAAGVGVQWAQASDYATFSALVGDWADPETFLITADVRS